VDAPDGAVMVSVDQFGIPGRAREYRALAQQRDWVWFEDGACALGAHEEGTWCATRADLALLSFHPRKILTTAEGGALVTGDPDLAREARVLRNLGMTGEGVDRCFRWPGFNARLSELHAAVGLALIDQLDDHLRRRRLLGRRYLARLESCPQVSWPRGYLEPGTNFQSMVVLLEPHLDRSRLHRDMAKLGVETTLPGFAIHLQPAFSQLETCGPPTCSARLHHSGLTLPLHEGMAEADVDRVVEALVAGLAAQQGGAHV